MDVEDCDSSGHDVLEVGVVEVASGGGVAGVGAEAIVDVEGLWAQPVVVFCEVGSHVWSWKEDVWIGKGGGSVC